jgi:hypothetical protein
MNKELANKITPRVLRNAYQRLGYPLLEDGRLNLFGVRALDMVAGTFNDILGIFLVFRGKDTLILHPGTVDPGSYYFNNPMNPEGTAVMKFQYVEDMYAQGLHKGYPALRQVRPAYFYRITKEEWERDGGKEIKLEGKKLTHDIIFANMHRASQFTNSYDIGLYSAACQVRQINKDHLQLMKMVKNIEEVQKRFGYALFGEQQFDFIGDLDPKTEKRI